VFFRSVLTLALGGSVGQIISFLLQPVITRIYTPEDMGVFSSLIAIISLWSVISVGRYDCAIILPDDKKTAQAIVYLCFIIALFVSILSGLWYLLRSFWGKPVSIETYRGYLFIPVLILLNACDLIFMRIAIRGKKIGALSLTQVLRQLGDKSTKIILGFFYNNPISLMIGTVVGEVIRISVLAHHTFRSFFIFDSEKISKNNIITVAKRYKKFPLLNTWSAFLDTASSQLPIILFSPNKALIPQGSSDVLGQQIDIFPTLVDLMGYQKPFRSWGRSLLANKADETPRAFVTNTQFYQLIQGNFIYVLDLQGEVVGVYAKDDLNLTHNLKDQIAHNEEMKKGIADLRAFMQDFMDRIINDKL